MNNIVLNLNSESYLVERLEYLSSYDVFINEDKKLDILSGIILLVENEILLVKPRKFKSKKHRWSIPKGHIEKGLTCIDNALKELKEETGIILGNIDDISTRKVYYKKNSKLKELNVFILRMTKQEVNLNVSKKSRNKKEIYKVKFFPLGKALNKIENGQVPLIKIIELYNETEKF